MSYYNYQSSSYNYQSLNKSEYTIQLKDKKYKDVSSMIMIFHSSNKYLSITYYEGAIEIYNISERQDVNNKEFQSILEIFEERLNTEVLTCQVYIPSLKEIIIGSVDGDLYVYSPFKNIQNTNGYMNNNTYTNYNKQNNNDTIRKLVKYHDFGIFNAIYTERILNINSNTYIHPNSISSYNNNHMKIVIASSYSGEISFWEVQSTSTNHNSNNMYNYNNNLNQQTINSYSLIEHKNISEKIISVSLSDTENLFSIAIYDKTIFLYNLNTLKESFVPIMKFSLTKVLPSQISSIININEGLLISSLETILFIPILLSNYYNYRLDTDGELIFNSNMKTLIIEKSFNNKSNFPIINNLIYINSQNKIFASLSNGTVQSLSVINGNISFKEVYKSKHLDMKYSTEVVALTVSQNDDFICVAYGNDFSNGVNENVEYKYYVSIFYI